MIQKNKNWLIISLCGLALSFVTMLLPVIVYTTGSGRDAGKVYSFPIYKLLDGNTFVDVVLYEYRGNFLNWMDANAANLTILLLCLIGASAVLLSLIGLKSMSKQYESAWPFVLTLGGIICTVIPAVALLIAVLMSGNAFDGTVKAGVYAYVTPLAMLMSCITVIKRHRLTSKERELQKAAEMYIRPAGDLPMQ